MPERPHVDQVYSRLRWLIIEGRYPPGTRLIEERLASDLGVSRTPVRQALARVAAEGLVHIFPNRGAVVRRFTTADLLEIYDLRALLEGHAAYLAASRIAPEQLTILKDAADALEQSLTQTFDSHTEEVRFLVEQNAIFHDTVLFAAGNERLTSIVHTVVDIPLQFRSFYWYTPEERQISNFFHRAILKALQQGDGERARAMMREHIYHGRDVLLQHFNDDQMTDIEQ
jgi:DNA-binding GntR family transcriptional regulator